MARSLGSHEYAVEILENTNFKTLLHYRSQLNSQFTTALPFIRVAQRIVYAFGIC